MRPALLLCPLGAAAHAGCRNRAERSCADSSSAAWTTCSRPSFSSSRSRYDACSGVDPQRGSPVLIQRHSDCERVFARPQDKKRLAMASAHAVLRLLRGQWRDDYAAASAAVLGQLSPTADCAPTTRLPDEETENAVRPLPSWNRHPWDSSLIVRWLRRRGARTADAGQDAKGLRTDRRRFLPQARFPHHCRDGPRAYRHCRPLNHAQVCHHLHASRADQPAP